MFKLFVASCIFAVASAGYIAQPAIIHAPTHVVHAAPVATSYSSSQVVHHSAPLIKTVPVVHAAPIVHSYHAAPLIKTVPVVHAAPIVHSYHAAPLVKTVSVHHQAPLIKTIHPAQHVLIH